MKVFQKLMRNNLVTLIVTSQDVNHKKIYAEFMANYLES